MYVESQYLDSKASAFRKKQNVRLEKYQTKKERMP